MRRRGGAIGVALTAALTALLACGCGGGRARPAPTAASTRADSSITLVMGDITTLDPARAATAQAAQVDWTVYAGLDTYRHARGQAGTALIPALATTLPRITDAGRTYTVVLRRGLRFSDGAPVVAGDVAATVERVLRIASSPVRRVLVGVVRGAASVAAGRARTVAGITTSDATGRIAIHLTRPDGAFDAILAEPALGIVPAGTPLRTTVTDPPPGVGPYRLSDIDPGRSFTLVRNPRWRPIAGIPSARSDLDVTVSDNLRADAFAVLNDVADVDDAARAIPASVVREIRARAGDRLDETGGGPVQYVFLDAHRRPFDDRLAREAVVSGLTARALAQLGDEAVTVGCDPRAGATVSCGERARTRPTLRRAAALVRRSGTAGDHIVVWSPRSAPVREWMTCAARVLREIGYVASVRTLSDRGYRAAIATLGAHPRTGLAARSPLRHGRWAIASPDPGAVAEPVAFSGGARTVPEGAYVVAIGEARVPELMSARMDEAAAIVNPIEGLDLTSLQLR